MDHLDVLTSETFQRTMKINSFSVFLAIKYAAAAMAKPNPSVGKSESGGSIILTASGECPSEPSTTGHQYNFFVVAGLRSGGGPVDCTSLRFCWFQPKLI